MAVASAGPYASLQIGQRVIFKKCYHVISTLQLTVAYFAVKRTVLTKILTEEHLFAKCQCHSYYTEDTTAGINDHFWGTVKFSGIYGHYKQ